MQVTRAVAIGCGHYLPKRVVPNSEFEEWLDTSDEWIKARTGIERRHFAAEDELSSHLGIEAARDALDDAGLEGADIDALIVATATPDQTFPSTATRIQHAIGMKGGFAFDIHAACAGFVYALTNANALIAAGQAKRVMVIGAETFSRIMDWEDRASCVLFGDGAGALILEARSDKGSNEDRGILACDIHSDGAYNELLFVDGGVSSTRTAGKLRMQGREVFKHAVNKLAASAQKLLEGLGMSGDDITWMVPHQANLRIIKSTADKLGLPMARVVLTVADHGNTSAASIPLALSTAHKKGMFKKNDLLLMEGIGGGLAWGGVVLRW